MFAGTCSVVSDKWDWTQHICSIVSCHGQVRSGWEKNVQPDTAATLIAQNERITFIYEQLSHWLQISKHHSLITSVECVIELTQTNNYLLQELTYHKDSQAADIKFHNTVIKLYVRLKEALKERSQKWRDTESTLLSYWDIDFSNENVEKIMFWKLFYFINLAFVWRMRKRLQLIEQLMSSSAKLNTECSVNTYYWSSYKHSL